MNSKKKGSLSVQAMAGLALAFTLLAIILGIGGTITETIRIGQCSTWNATSYSCPAAQSTIAFNTTTYGNAGINTMGSWLPTIALIIAAAVVIGVIIRYFQD